MTSSTQLAKTYSKLSRTAQHVAQVAALSLQPTGKSTLVQMSTSSSWQLESGRPLNALKAAEATHELTRAGVLKAEAGLGNQISHEFIGLAVHDSLRTKTFEAIATAVQKVRPSSPTYYWTRASNVLLERDMRIAFYRNDAATFTRLAQHADSYPAVLDPYDAELFSNLKPALQEFWLRINAVSVVQAGGGSPAVLEILPPFAAAQKELTPELRDAWIDLCVARGDLSELATIDDLTGGQFVEIRGCIETLRGNFDEADLLFEERLTAIRKKTRKRKLTLGGFPGVLHVSLQLGKQTVAGRLRAKELLAAAESQWDPHFSCAVDLFNDAVDCMAKPMGGHFSGYARCKAPIVSLLAGWLWRWTNSSGKNSIAQAEYLELAKSYRQFGLNWMADEFSKLGGSKASKKNSTDAISLLELVKQLEPWERSLSALESLAGSNGSGGAVSSAAAERLIWSIVLLENGTDFELQPLVQKASKKGGWLKGRAVALKRLHADWDSDDFAYLTDVDREICRLIEERIDYGGWRRYRDVSYILPLKAVQRLVGHPLLFLGGDRTTPIELVRQEPRLIVQKNESSKRLTAF